MRVQMAARPMIHDVDPRADLLEKALKAAEGKRIGGHDLLLAVYTPPEKTKGGIIITTNTRDENRWQGKVCLLVAQGPLAWTNEAANWFSPLPEIGDWVSINVNDGLSLVIDDVPFRLIQDSYIRMVLKENPDQIV